MDSVRDLMTRNVLTIRADELVDRAVAVILQHGVSSLPVVDEQQRFVGIVTEYALLDVMFRPELQREPVGRIMCRDVLTVAPEATPQDAANLLVKHRLRRLPVVRGDALVGLVSRRDLIRYATSGSSPTADLQRRLAHDAMNPRSTVTRLLAVDDSPIIHELFRDALQPLQYELTCISRGEHAVKAVRDGDYDLILLDRFLPDVDGLEVLQQLRAARSTAPVIMVTSCDLPRHVAEALDAGAVDYIRKPFSAMEVRARVQAALRNYRLRCDLQAAKAEAEAASRSKSEFLANISHEIRTPMTAILGYAELLDEALTDPAHAQSVGAIHRNGRRLLEIIDDILDVARIEAGRLEIESADTSPIEIVRDVVQMMQVRAEERGVELRTEFGGKIPKTVLTDSRRLRQILLNLVGNAVKFTERGGQVRVAVALAANHAGCVALEIEVSDTGVGIEPKMIEHVFEPFTQADTSPTRAHGGAGLGLAICRSLAEALGGSLRVRSQVGRGSVFTLSIGIGHTDALDFAEDDDAERPVRLAPPMPSKSTSDSEGLLAGCRVLLAEDGPDNQRLISLILRKAGAEVVLAKNGLEALHLALAESNDFDVVLMDIQMPVMDGCEATRRLRAAGFDRPIVALTAHAMAGDRQSFLLAGCDEFMSKPVHKNELTRLVLRHARNTPLSAT